MTDNWCLRRMRTAPTRKNHQMRFLFILALLCITACKGQQPCQITVEQAPSLRGLRLGMTTKDLVRQFATLQPIKRSSIGISTVRLVFVPREKYVELDLRPDYLINNVNYPDFRDVNTAEILFLEDRAYSITVFYQNPDLWRTSDQFVSHISPVLGFTGPWDSTLLDFKTKECGMISAKAGFKSVDTISRALSTARPLPFMQVIDSASQEKARLRERDQDTKERQKLEGERKAFRP